jgi:hypothetical protein
MSHDPRNALWSFETARFAVCFFADPEEMDPADSFAFPEDIEAVRSGAVDWFSAAVVVFLKDPADPEATFRWRQVGADYLGGCAYDSARSFTEGENRNGYFRDMVRQAADDTRRNIAHMPHLRSPR